MLYRNPVVLALVCCLPALSASAEDSEPGNEAIRAAISRALPLLEKGSAGSAAERTCFTCHNQALPAMALSAARRRGFAIDEENLQRQLDHTSAHLHRGLDNYLKGRGQGGRVITAGYALWALEAGQYEPDETTAAVAAYLLKYQKEADHWRHPGSRPPSSGSDFTTTYVALRGLAAFGTPEQEPQIESRVDKVRQWLLTAEPKDTEDRVFRLRGLAYAAVNEEVLQTATRGLLDAQREDGGWAQTAELESDAYATGTVLMALLDAGGLSATDPAVRRGLRFLLDKQLDDGSWHVVTRAKPFQTYYESGFPHEEDQFISISASSWATLALLRAVDGGEVAEQN